MNRSPSITPELIAQHGLSPEEYRKIVDILGREPNHTELGIFSVMWSEHCSYKSSRSILKRLPTTGGCVVQGPGENAGVIDIGDGQVAVFKIESHNHPSFIEPYQGAATGVGGILRDIFTMGARPIALLDSLRFGPLNQPRNRYLFERVVAGIAGYGNCIGVPTVGGEVYFDPIYSLNPLVNVFCLGVAHRNGIFLGQAKGTGNSVIYVGSKTGRDGIHGATMASEEFDESSAQRRPTVQVGDPFTEKLLLEACLELMKSGCLVGIQDMGAAGLTCSTAEMASRGGSGIEIDIARVPRRETGMNPYEIMLSESQERMLLVARRGKEEQIARIFDKWDLDCVTIGQVIAGGRLRVNQNGQLVADIPVGALTDEAPLYLRPRRKPAYLKEISAPVEPKEPDDYHQLLLDMLSQPTIASKEWVFRQYDHMVRTNTALLPGAGASLIRLKGSRRALALTVDGNSGYCYLDPYVGGMLAVAEAARNLVCTGARPLAITNCLNFGNPERPEIMWQFARVVKGIAEACEYLDTPVTGGNVSFYNETSGEGIYPTPVIGMVGLLADVSKGITPWFKQPGDVIVLLGKTEAQLGGSQYLKYTTGKTVGQLPAFSLAREKNLQTLCLEAADQGWLQSAHDLSEGGLGVALAECCLINRGDGLGAKIKLDLALRPDVSLFGESPSRILVSAKTEHLTSLEGLAAKHDVPFQVLGEVTPGKLIVQGVLELSLDKLDRTWRGSIPGWMERGDRREETVYA
jgi:phosphoribosylformylglycinamidine synthase